MRDELTPVARVQRADAELKVLAARINDREKKTDRAVVLHAKEQGDDLLKAKAAAGHGNWERWVEDNLDVSAVQAWRYMKFARDLSGDLEKDVALWKRIGGNAPAEEKARTPGGRDLPDLPPAREGYFWLRRQLAPDGAKAALVPLASVRTDGGTHPRHADEAYWAYANQYSAYYRRAAREGAPDPPCDTMPPLACVKEGATYWLYDGFLRLAAMKKAGLEVCRVAFVEGDLSRARWLAGAANREWDDEDEDGGDERDEECEAS